MPNENAPRTTNIDSLLELLKEHGKLELSEIQTALGMDQRVIENWSKVLEDGGLVKISFSAGRMFVEPIVNRPEELAIKERQLGVKTEQLEQELSRQRAQLDKFTKMVDELGATATTIEAIFRRRMPPALEERMNDIAKSQQRIESIAKEAESSRARAEAELGAISKKFADMVEKLDYFTSSKLEVNLNESIAKIDESAKKVAELRAAMDAISKNKDKAFSDMKASINAQLSGMNADIDSLLKESEQRSREYIKGAETSLKTLNKSASVARGGLRELDAFRRQEGEVRRLLEELKVKFTDQYDKIFEDVKKGESVIRSAVEAQRREFEELKAKNANPEQILEAISSTKAEVSSALEQVKAVREELAKRQAEIARLAEVISKLGDKFVKLEADAKGSMPKRTQERMAEITKAAQIIESSSARAESVRKAAEQYFAEANKRMTEMANKLGAINASKAGQEVEESARRVADAEAGLARLRESLSKAIRERDDDLRGLRRDVTAQLRDIDRQIGTARSQIDPQIRAYMAEAEASLKSLAEQAETARRSVGRLSEFKKEADSAKKALADAQSRYVGGYERMLAETRKKEESIKVMAEEARKGFEELKEAMGDPAKLYDSVSSTRDDITKLRGDVAKVNSALAELLRSAAEFRRMERARAPVEQRMRKADELINKSIDTSLQLADIGAKADKAAADITGLAGAELTKMKKGRKQKQMGRIKPTKAGKAVKK